MSQNFGLPLFVWAERRPVAEIVDLGAYRERSARWALKLLPNEVPASDALDKCLRLAPPTPVVPFDRRRA